MVFIYYALKKNGIFCLLQVQEWHILLIPSIEKQHILCDTTKKNGVFHSLPVHKMPCFMYHASIRNGTLHMLQL